MIYKKWWFWVIAVILVIIIGAGGSSDNNILNLTNNYQENIEITNLKFNETEIELDIKETKDIILEVLPEKANIENLELCTSNSEIATLEKTNSENTGSKITIKVQPITEGECEVYAAHNEIESNKIKIKIIDNERIEREKKEAEEQAKKEAEEQTKKQTQTTNTQKNSSSSQTTSTSSQQSTGSSSSQSNSNNTHGKSVYRTPSGKRYHFDPDCGGKNSYQTTLDAAKSAGLTPCKKCAQY